jgi:dinuclear metal center YbgI/SA1388 family protein
MTIKDIMNTLESWAPTAYAEDFDNVGLLVGDETVECTKTLITLDTTEAVVDEAIKNNCQLIISFHPIIFSGLKKLTGKTYVERAVLKAIKNNIAIYAIHTALDNHKNGVSYQMGVELGLEDQKILIPKKDTLLKLTTYVPEDATKEVLNALHKAGGGAIGNYEECSFSSKGIGRFTGNENSNPSVGKKGIPKEETENQLNLIFQKHKEQDIITALKNNHPYEEVAYEISIISNKNQDIGMGSIGYLPKAMEEKDFLSYVKKNLNCTNIRHSNFNGRKIKKVALLGGSGSFAIGAAKAQNADVLITSDLKYHNFFESENKILLADIGHYESEQFTNKLIASYLTKKMTNFACILSQEKTNPVNYF